jgi:hypothetical protein
MATLSDADRREIWARFMSELSNEREPVAVTKADLRAAFDALDQWADDNAASANQALPVAARNGLTTSQKARLLMEVVRQRYVKGV